jgi:hypothetical protein
MRVGSKRSPAKRVKSLGRQKPMKVSASVSAEARTLAGIKTLKRRSTDQPQEGIGLREEARLCKWNLTLKGETPRAGPARNKAGRCWADESLESVRNAEEAP